MMTDPIGKKFGSGLCVEVEVSPTRWGRSIALGGVSSQVIGGDWSMGKNFANFSGKIRPHEIIDATCAGRFSGCFARRRAGGMAGSL
jgi:hypothetical protein